MGTTSPLARPHLYNVTAPPRRLDTSLRAGWDGALFVQVTTAPAGEIHQEQEFLVIERRRTPLCARPVRGAGGWTTHGPGTWLQLPGSRHDGEWRGTTEWQYLFVTPERIEAVLGRSWDRSGLARWGEPEREVPFVGELLSAMAHDHAAGHPAGPLAGDALVVAALTHLDGRPVLAGPPRRGALGRRLDRVRDYVEANLARPPSVAELAAQAGVGVRQLGVIFTAETGWSPHRYVLHRRIERAKELMRDPELSLAAISAALGFADPPQFSRVFRQYVGASPSTFRRERS